MSDRDLVRELLQTGATAQALRLDSAVVEKLAAFAELFFRWNERINLGGRIGPRELVEQHFADAFAAARFVSGQQAVIDVGTGGGLPAIPLAVVRGSCTYDLWEPTAKKVAFLRTAVRELELDGQVRITAGRVDERAVTQLAGRFDIASSRATFAPLDWLAMGRRLVRPGGRVLVFATEQPVPGSLQPEEFYDYRGNRRLLVFGSQPSA